MGGVARRATVIKEARASGDHVLLVDAGNSVFPPPQGKSSKEPGEASRGQVGVEVLNRLGYDAVALGASDVLLGIEDLRKRVGEATGFSFVSANLIDKSTGRPFVEPFVIKSVAGRNVAMVGITGQIDEGNAEFATTDALAATREAVSLAQAEADIVIVLSNAGAAINKRIAAEVPGVDVIVSGGGDPLPSAVREASGAVVVQADHPSPAETGRAVGDLRAEFDASGTLGEYAWAKVDLDPTIKDDSETSAWVATLPKR